MLTPSKRVSPPHPEAPSSKKPKLSPSATATSNLQLTPAPPAAPIGTSGTPLNNKSRADLIDRSAEKERGQALLHRLDGPSTAKAGLTRDPEEVRQIIYDASKGSKYFKNQEERSDKVEKRIEQMMVRLEEMLKTKKDLTPEEKTVDRMLLDLEKTRDLSQTIVVVDADAFYASVEELYNPELKGKIFAVSGGVILTASYEARKFGVRSGMAGYIAEKLCPGILMVKPDFKRYSEASKKVMDVLATFDPNYAPASLDEAYLKKKKKKKNHLLLCYIAEKLCPGILMVKPDFKRYSEASKKVMDVLATFDPNYAPASLDEAYLNVTSYIVSLYLSGYSNSNKRNQKQNGLTPEEVGVRIREKVKEISGLTVSCGVTPNCMLSKIAADLNKPNRDAIKEFMKNMPVRKVPGIGRVSERWLQALEIKTLGDVFDSRGRLYLVRNEIGLGFLLRGYLGLGSTKVEPHKREGRKSIGNEQTFTTIWKEEDLDAKLREIAKNLETDMKEGGWSGRTISLGYKLDTFETFSRASSLPKGRYIHRFEDLYQEGKKILMKELKARQTLFDSGGKVVGCGGKRELRLRLMGLTMSNLRDEQAIAEQAKKGLDSWVVTLKEQDNVTAGQSSKHRLEDNEVKLFEADDLVQGVDIREGDDEEEEKEFRFRPYYTGGPSINSKRHSTNGQERGKRRRRKSMSAPFASSSSRWV
ncbi:IMS-domain-containing protein [Atractiella rhizophila]|nr:IMS-domain-containing protein [Atractiella rhizophila]